MSRIAQIPQIVNAPGVFHTNSGPHERIQFSRKVSYHNHTNTKIHFTDRNSVTLVLLPTRIVNPLYRYEGCVVITVEYYFEDIERSQLDIQLNIIDAGLQPELVEMRKAIESAQDNKYQYMRQQPLTAKLEYLVSLDTIKEHHGALYLDEIDVAISLPSDAPPVHPYSKVGRLALAEAAMVKDVHPKVTSMLTFRIVDNAGKIGDRYLKLLGHVYRVEALKSPGEIDGFYVYRRGYVASSLPEDLDQAVTEHYTADEVLSKFNFHPTYTLAWHSEDDGVLLKLEAETKRQEAEARRLLQETELAERRHETALKKIEHDKEVIVAENRRLLEEGIQSSLAHRREIERLTVKDHYEHMAHRRKDWESMVKFVPVIVAGLGAALIAAKQVSTMRPN